MTYTNAEFRSILCGLGYLGRESVTDGNSPDFPVTNDDDDFATDANAINAVIAFQKDYGLQTDGIVGQETTAKAQTEMNAIHTELNAVVNSDFSMTEPFYGPRTVDAVKQFQGQINVQEDGIASNYIRRRLNDYYIGNADNATRNKTITANH